MKSVGVFKGSSTAIFETFASTFSRFLVFAKSVPPVIGKLLLESFCNYASSWIRILLGEKYYKIMKMYLFMLAPHQIVTSIIL